MKQITKIIGVFLTTFVFMISVNAKTDIESLGYDVKDSGIFDVIGNKGIDDYSTTYENYGYYTKLIIDNKEIIFSDEHDDFKISDEDYSMLEKNENTITYNNPEYGKLVMDVKNLDATTVVVTYQLTNNTGKKVPFKLGTTSDVDFAGNDEAAIIKDNNSFIITQDNMYDSAYKAQLKITLNTIPTTTYIGPYCSDEDEYYYINIYNNGEKEYYTASNDVDTALAYSWQGEIEAGETKTYTATFSLGEAEIINLNFYHLEGENSYGEPEVINVLGGGEATLAEITNSSQGYNYKWYTNQEGTGKSYYSEQIIVAPNEETNYYEVKKTNTIAENENIILQNYADAKLETEDLKEKVLSQFKEQIEQSYDDINIVLEVEDITETIPEEEKQLIDEKINTDYKMGVYFDASLYLVTTKENNDTSIDQITKLDNPIKIMFQLPENMKNQDSTMKRQYQVLRLHEGKVDTIDAYYDEQNNILTFETDEFSTYALTYKDSLKQLEENPNTVDNIYLYILIGSMSLISLIGLKTLKKYN